jgi:hypothetical protein
MDDLEIEAHRIGSTGPHVNGTAYVANMETEVVSLEPDGSEEDRPEYLRYVPYSQIHREEKVQFNSFIRLEGRSYAITRSS